MSLQTFLMGKATNIAFQPRKNELKTHFIAAGTPVHPLRPVQNMELLRQALLSEGGHGITMQSSDYNVLRAATELFEQRFKSDIRKISTRMGVKDPNKNIQFRSKPKDLGRMRDKARNEYGGDGSVHTDTNACFIFAGSVETVRRLTEFFRPSNNSRVVELKEKSSSPDETGFCGNTVKLATTLDIGAFKEVPFIGEIIILRQGCKADYEASHKEVERLRSIDKFWNADLMERKGLSDNAVIVAVGRAAARFGRSQFALNQHMAVATGMSELRNDRFCFLVDDQIPVMVLKDKRGCAYDRIVTPDPTTGLYKVDNAFATTLDKARQISEEAFFTAAVRMTPAPDYALSGAARPALQMAV